MSGAGTLVVGEFSVDTSSLDFNDHSSHVEDVQTANITLISLVGLFVGLRIFVRSCVVRKVFLDDVLILVAAGFTIALAAVCLAAINHGLGTHVWLLPTSAILDNVKSCIHYLFVCQVLYACAIAFTKIAIIASCLRFIQDSKFHIAMYGTGAVIGSLWVTGVFVTLFQCRPVKGAWEFTVSDRKCINFVDYLYASSSVSVATDIILCVLPCPYLWRLQMPLKQRIILCLLFAGGAGACIAGIIRIANLHTLRSVDVTYQCVQALNLSVLECSLGIICVSIPPLRPLVMTLFPKALRTNPSSSAKSPLHSLSHLKRASRIPNDTESQPESRQSSDHTYNLGEDNSSAPDSRAWKEGEAKLAS